MKKEDIIKGIEELKVQLAGVSEVIKGQELPTISEEEKQKLRSVFEGLKTDSERFRRDIESGRVKEDIRRDIESAGGEIEKGVGEIEKSMNELGEAIAKMFGDCVSGCCENKTDKTDDTDSTDDDTDV
ncbi:MAG: hypothetical protein IKR73_07505 [Oscillospiraceae bacterium]|nr:hypothetical protein [Oscillospiraceae bacterium]